VAAPSTSTFIRRCNPAARAVRRGWLPSDWTVGRVLVAAWLETGTSQVDGVVDLVPVIDDFERHGTESCSREHGHMVSGVEDDEVELDGPHCLPRRWNLTEEVRAERMHRLVTHPRRMLVFAKSRKNAAPYRSVDLTVSPNADWACLTEPPVLAELRW
jgi:hypothetical protein